MAEIPTRLSVPDPRVGGSEQTDQKKVGFGANQVAPLRYPLEILDDQTDYLQINIVKYVPSGLTRSEAPEEFLPVGNLKVGGVPGQITFTGQNGKTVSYADTPNNRKFAAKAQGLGDPIPVGGTYSVNRANRKTSNKKGLNTIILPIPSNIQDGNSVNFASGSLDGFTAQALGVVKDTFDASKTGDIAGAFLTALRQGTAVGMSEEVRGYFLKNLEVQAANIFGGNLTVAQLVARETGQILNPNMELFFEGVNLRSFKFSFKMTPRDGNEARSIKRIIRTLKQNMAPQADNTFYLSTPNIFELTYKNGSNEHPFLHKFKQCALTDMSVNYTGEGTYATYGEGTPISIIMDLSFKELEPIYSGDYDDSIPGVGY